MLLALCADVTLLGAAHVSIFTLKIPDAAVLPFVSPRPRGHPPENLMSQMCPVCAQGLVSREAIRGQFDGSLFYQLARKNEARKAAQHRAKQR